MPQPARHISVSEKERTIRFARHSIAPAPCHFICYNNPSVDPDELAEVEVMEICFDQDFEGCYAHREFKSHGACYTEITCARILFGNHPHEHFLPSHDCRFVLMPDPIGHNTQLQSNANHSRLRYPGLPF